MSHVVFTSAGEGVVEVTNRDGVVLGWISWDDGWKCRVFEAEVDVQFSSSCMEDIVKFMDRRLS